MGEVLADQHQQLALKSVRPGDRSADFVLARLRIPEVAALALLHGVVSPNHEPGSRQTHVRALERRVHPAEALMPAR